MLRLGKMAVFILLLIFISGTHRANGAETIGSVGYKLKKDGINCYEKTGSTDMKRSTAPLQCARYCSFREHEYPPVTNEFVLYDNKPESDMIRCSCVERKCYEEENPKATLYSITIDEELAKSELANLGFQLKEDNVYCKKPPAYEHYGLRRLSLENQLTVQMECAKRCRLYGKFQIFNQVTCECVDGECDKNDRYSDFSSLYTVTKDKSASLGYQLKKDKASCSNRKRKPDVKTFYAASLCAKHCSGYKEFVISGPMKSKKEDYYNGYYNPYNRYRCYCVEGECDEVEDNEFRESSIYTVTKGKGPCLDAITHLEKCQTEECNIFYSVDDTSDSRKFCPKTCKIC